MPTFAMGCLITTDGQWPAPSTLAQTHTERTATRDDNSQMIIVLAITFEEVFTECLLCAQPCSLLCDTQESP